MLLDAFVLCVLAVSLLIGMLRGLVREVMTVLALGGGIAAAWAFAPSIAPYIALWLGAPTEPLPPDTPEPQFLGILPFDTAGTVIAWGSILLGVILTLSLISHFLAEAAKAAGLGGVDAALGALFGVARGLAVVLVLYLPVHMLAGKNLREAWLSGGSSYEVLESASIKILPFLPSTQETQEDKEQDITQTQEQDEKDLMENPESEILPTPIPFGDTQEIQGIQDVQEDPPQETWDNP